MSDRVKTARKKLLQRCRILHSRFQECNTNLLSEIKDNFILESSLLADALELLTTSDDQIALLHAEVILYYTNGFLFIVIQ